MGGEPSEILENIGRQNLRLCGTSAEEIIAASFGLMELMGEGEDGLKAVRVEISQRPTSLSIIAA